MQQVLGATRIDSTGAGRTAGTLALVLLGSPRMLQAYIDPGSGSMLLQVLVGGLLALAAGVRFYWRKVTLLFRGSKDGKPSDN